MSSNARRVIIGVSLAVFILLVATVFASTSPGTFPGRSIFSIQDGSSLSSIAHDLEDAKIIRSPFLFKTFVVLIGGSTKVIRGDYLFDQPQSVLRVAYRISRGVQGLARYKVTIPEGLDSVAISNIVKKSIPGFDTAGFITLARKNEGYLFPDTYFFFENVKPADVVSAMRANFNKQTVTLLPKVASFGKPLADVVTMASIVEKEATSTVDRQIIAGILWKRLANNIALQVDPPFFYYLNKTSEQLTVTDLAADSPYNLYKHTGLTPTPIDNPGIDALQATLNASSTKYFFYLSDRKGNMHYATTYEAHLANKAKYM